MRLSKLDRLYLLAVSYIKNGINSQLGKVLNDTIITSEDTIGIQRHLLNTKYVESGDGKMGLTKQGAIEVYNMLTESAPRRMTDSELMDKTLECAKELHQRALKSKKFAEKLSTKTEFLTSMGEFYSNFYNLAVPAENTHINQEELVA